MILHGRNIKIFEWGHPIGQSKSCTIQCNGEASECASKTSARSRDFLAGRTDWNLTINKFVDSITYDMVHAGREYVVQFVVDDDDMLTGSAICTEVRMQATEGKLAEASLTFLGNGELQ